jgi:hypothetical protein
MTKQKLQKFHMNTIREVEYYADICNIEPEDLITKIQNETFGLDEYGNASVETFLQIGKKFNIPEDVAKHFYYLR